VSRYKIQVRQADSLHGTFACDSVYVDDGGDLHVNRKHSGNDLLTIARFQHGHWSSYELEPTADPDVEAWLREGVMTREQFLGRAQAEPTDDCADAPVKTEALPALDETVHVWAKDGAPGCTPMHVVGYLGGRVIPAAGLYLQGFCATAASPIRRYSSPSHDETRTEPCSWHYPCGGDDHAAEPEPRPLEPTTVTIELNISGGCTIDPADLQAVISRYMLDRH
jgi:hypothetical protein